jgi:hypothetical protein
VVFCVVATNSLYSIICLRCESTRSLVVTLPCVGSVTDAPSACFANGGVRSCLSLFPSHLGCDATAHSTYGVSSSSTVDLFITSR